MMKMAENKLPKSKKEFIELFGTGAKYPIKLDGETAWKFYNDLTPKQKESCFRIRETTIKALSEAKINDIIVNIAKIDKTYLEVILKSTEEKVALIDSLKTNVNLKDIYDAKTTERLALNKAKKTEEKSTESVFDTSGVGALIKANCTLKLP